MGHAFAILKKKIVSSTGVDSPYLHGSHFPLTPRSGWDALMLQVASHISIKNLKKL